MSMTAVAINGLLKITEDSDVACPPGIKVKEISISLIS